MWQLSLNTNCKPDLITMHQWLTVCKCEQCSQALRARGEFRRGVPKIDACSFGIQQPHLSYVWASTYIFSTLLSTPGFSPKQQSLIALIFHSTFLLRLFTFSHFHSVFLKLSVLYLSIPLWGSFLEPINKKRLLINILHKSSLCAAAVPCSTFELKSSWHTFVFSFPLPIQVITWW